MQGKIEKWFNEKNFGFINIGEAKGLFFHRNELTEGYTPKEGDLVEFEKTQTDKGPAAIKVKKVEETAPSEEVKTDEPESGLKEVTEKVKPDEGEIKTAEEVKEEETVE